MANFGVENPLEIVARYLVLLQPSVHKDFQEIYFVCDRVRNSLLKERGDVLDYNTHKHDLR